MQGDDIVTYCIQAQQVPDVSENLVKITITENNKILDTRIIEVKDADDFKRQLSGFITEVTFKGKIGVA